MTWELNLFSLDEWKLGWRYGLHYWYEGWEERLLVLVIIVDAFKLLNLFYCIIVFLYYRLAFLTKNRRMKKKWLSTFHVKNIVKI